MSHHDKKFINYDHTLEEYLSKYKNKREYLLKYTRKEVDEINPDGNLYNNLLLKGRRWWCINNVYYEIPKPPRWVWFRNLNKSIQLTTAIILGGLVISSITVPTILLVNKIRDMNNTSINVINNKDADDIINKIVLKLTTTGDYVGSFTYKPNRAFNFIESYDVILNDKTLSKDKDYKLDNTSNTLTIFSKTAINNKSKVELNIVKALPSITINPSSISIGVSQSSQLSATVKSLIGNVTWESLNPLVASVDADTGLVTGVTPNTTTIRAYIDGVTGVEGTCTVTVTA